jgi:hypothetical protein
VLDDALLHSQLEVDAQPFLSARWAMLRRTVLYAWNAAMKSRIWPAM